MTILSKLASTMLFTLLTSLYALSYLTSASFTNCGSSSYPVLPVTELVADPSGIVASEQPVHFRIGFTVPNDIYIGHAIVEINTSWNGIQVPTQRSGLGTYLPLPLTSRAYVIDYNTTFPPKISIPEPIF